MLIARTDANSAKLLTTHIDERDEPFVTDDRTSEGFLRYKGGIDAAISRGLAYARLQDHEFDLAATQGYTAVKHQSFVGTGYFDAVSGCVTGGEHSTAALAGSTEEEQFH